MIASNVYIENSTVYLRVRRDKKTPPLLTFTKEFLPWVIHKVLGPIQAARILLMGTRLRVHEQDEVFVPGFGGRVRYFWVHSLLTTLVSKLIEHG